MSTVKKRVRFVCILSAAGFLFFSFLLVGDADKSNGHDYKELVKLFNQFRKFQKPVVINGVPDYTPEAMKKQYEQLEYYQKKLREMDLSGWSVSRQVDYHLVRAEMNGLEFDHRVLRPWFRDPAFYVVIDFQFGPKMEGAFPLPPLPLSMEKKNWLKKKFQAIPKIIKQAKGNLTEGTSDLAMLGIRSKNREIDLLKDYMIQLQKFHPEMVIETKKILNVLVDFRHWLEKQRNSMTASSGIGKENYNWYLKHVQLLPYTWDEMMTISIREYERAMACMKLEEHKNRHLPLLKPAREEMFYVRQFNESQKFLLKFLEDQEIMTVPDFLKLRPIKSWKASSTPDYFKHVMDRDPLPLMPHDFVGHSPDENRTSIDNRPIRGGSRLYFIDGTRAEALATGIEEILMHVGLHDKRPRARELIYNLLAFRAARAISDLKMHSNEYTLAEGFRFNVQKTPYRWLPADSPTMWHDIELYMRQPSYGTGYLIGSVQLQKLLAEWGISSGSQFELRKFMDEFFAVGMVPMVLAHWELTGSADEINKVLSEENKK